MISNNEYVESLYTIDDYVCAFNKAFSIERRIYLIRGVFMKFRKEGLKELAQKTGKSIDEYYECASLDWFIRNLKRKKNGHKKKRHITAGESIAPIITKKLTNPYRKVDGWDLRRDGVRNDFC